MFFIAGLVGFLLGAGLTGLAAYRVIKGRFLNNILHNPQSRSEAKFLEEVARTLYRFRGASGARDNGPPERQAPLDGIEWLALQRGAACLVDGVGTMHDGTTINIAEQLTLIRSALMEAYIGLDEASVVLSGLAEQMTAGELADHPSKVMRAIAGQTDMYPLQVPMVRVAHALGIDHSVNDLGTGGAALWERNRTRLFGTEPGQRVSLAATAPEQADPDRACLHLIRLYGQTIEAITTRIAEEPFVPGVCATSLKGAARLADNVEHIAQDALFLRAHDTPDAKRERLQEDLQRLVSVLPGIAKRLGDRRSGQPLTLPAQQEFDHIALMLAPHPPHHSTQGSAGRGMSYEEQSEHG
jgi:hypothetical protein